MIEYKSTHLCDICGKEVECFSDLFPTMLPYTYDPEPELSAPIKTTARRWAQFDLCADCKKRLGDIIKTQFADIQSTERLSNPIESLSPNPQNYRPERTKVTAIFNGCVLHPNRNDSHPNDGSHVG